ncbi:MAG: CHAT domain-containing protein [Chloroflexia bacterium]
MSLSNTDNPTFELVLQGTGTPNTFVAYVPNSDGTRAAEHQFEWRANSPSLAMTLGELEGAAIKGERPKDDLHITFGKRLFDTVFAGPIGDLWRERFGKLKRGQYLRLVLRPDPETARPLLNLPWEYLHDGKGFLATNWRTPISRLPWGLPDDPLDSLTEPLRVLVIISSPSDLAQDQVLNFAKEEDLILTAHAEARRAGLVEVEFTPNGSIQALSTYLREFDPHILHFTGHGVFNQLADSGYLLMEDEHGHKARVTNGDFAELLERQGKSLRLAFLSACQSARVARNEAYTDLGPRLLKAGIPAVVAMQFSVLNHSAMHFGGDFYKGIADGKSVDEALTEAREILRKEGLNTVDFATPVLFLSDPDCLSVALPDNSSLPVQRPQDLTGLTVVQNFVGRSAELRTLQTGLDPQDGKWRAVVIHGLGGMGKTVLSARLAQRMALRFRGVLSIRMTPTTTAQSILDRIADFFLVNGLRLGINDKYVQMFVNAVRRPVALEAKASLLVDILAQLPILLIFDNYEDVLPEGRKVSRAANPAAKEGDMPPQVGEIDPDLPKLIGILVGNTPSGSRFLFTSRYDFDPVEPGRISNSIYHLPLREMGFREAVYLMETLPPLDALPIANVDKAELTPEEAKAARPLSMRAIYKALGGHPFTLALFAQHSAKSSAREVFSDLSGVKRELMEFTLLERAAQALPPGAATLLRRAAIYDSPVPKEGLSFIMGDDQIAMLPVDDEVEALLDWGLLAHPPGDDDYQLHTPVRDWILDGMLEDERQHLLGRAADFWMVTGRESGDLYDYLIARHYLFLAGRYKEAGSIVNAATELLLRWGQIELLLSLLEDNVRTLEGQNQAVTLGNRATVYRALGKNQEARDTYEEVLKIFQQEGAR